MDRVKEIIELLIDNNMETKNMRALYKVISREGMTENNLNSILEVKLDLKIVYNVLHG